MPNDNVPLKQISRPVLQFTAIFAHSASVSMIKDLLLDHSNTDH